MRVDDLDDRTDADIARRQLDDLTAIGLTWDEPAQWQTAHTTRYDSAIAALADRGLLYECYCSRRDIAAGAACPARAAGSVSRDMPRPDRLRTREPARRDRPAARAEAAHRRDHSHGSRSAARRLHRNRRRLRGASRRRGSGVQPGRRRRRRSTGRRPGGARRRPAVVVATAGVPRRTARPSGADVRARRAGAQRGRGPVGQTRRRRHARRDRRAARAGADRRIPWLAGVVARPRCSRSSTRPSCRGEPWIYRS